jgi:hypothetical protein
LSDDDRVLFQGWVFPMRRVLLAVAAMASLSACSAITDGEVIDQVQINSDPPGVKVTTSLGQTCTTPCTITVLRNDEFIVFYQAPGYRPMEVPVLTKSVTSVAAIARNFMRGIADNHVPNPVYAQMMPAGVSAQR